MIVDADTRAVRGAALVLARADRDVKRRVQRETRGRLKPLWSRLITSRAVSPLEQAVYLRSSKPTASVSATGGKLVTAQRRRALSGGLTPGAGDWPFVEFGSTKAHALRGQLPYYHRSGRIAFDAAARWGPTAAKVWLATIVDVYTSSDVITDG